jgi:hypothetical protein
MNGATLWAWSQKPGFPASLNSVLHALHAGGGVNDWREPVPAVLAGVDAVFLTGGRAKETGIGNAFAGLPCAVIFGEESDFGGERGGFVLLQSRGLSGWVADLGKSQLKLATPGRRWIFPRDRSRLRMASGVSPADEPAQRRRLREFIALNLQFAITETNERPGAMVFALPTRVDSDGTPRSSNYAGMQGDRMLLPEALALAGLSGLPLLVLNDAELAAHSARLDLRLAGFRKILVLTLGFGIGAALIQRRP